MRFLTAWVPAASCLWMSFLMFRAWWFPRGLDGGRWVKYGVGIMVIEFLVVHSSLFLAGLRVFSGSRFTETMPKHLALAWFKPGMMPVLLAGFYLLFALAIAAAFRSSVLFFSFAVLMLVRLFGFWQATTQGDAGMAEPLARSVISVVLYLFVVMLSVIVPIMVGGIDHSLLEEVYADRGTGLWEAEPQRALAAGALYFLLMGLAELTIVPRFSH